MRFGFFSWGSRQVAAHAAGPAAHKDFSPKLRKKLAGTGAAMPDGSYPIENENDLKNAIRSYGRAKDPEAVKRHIKSRAKSLGLTRLLPDDWESHASQERAIHAITLPIGAGDAGGPPEWVEVIPAGTFSGIDGRGPYHNSDPQGVVDRTQKLIESHMTAGLPVDLDHAGTSGLGLPAPAVGWMKQFAVRNGAIFAKVEWTEEGAAAIQAGKWKYISPVYAYEKPADAPADASTGVVTQLQSIALTNNPNLNLPPVKNAQETRTEDMPFTAAEVRLIAIHAKKRRPLHETVRALQEALPHVHPNKILDMAKMANMPDAMNDAEDGDYDYAADDDDGDGDAAGDQNQESPEQMASRHAAEMAECGTDEERSQCAARHAEETKMFAPAAHRAVRHSSTQGRQMTKQELDAAVARHPMVLALNKALGEMRQESAVAKATRLVDTAIEGGKLVPAQREWAIAYCAANQAGFEAFIGKQPTLAINNGEVVGVKPPVRDALDPANLTDADREICAQTNTDPKKFLAQRQENLAIMQQKNAPGALIKIEMGVPKTATVAA